MLIVIDGLPSIYYTDSLLLKSVRSQKYANEVRYVSQSADAPRDIHKERREGQDMERKCIETD